jgi:hypothetical protein
MIDASLRVLIDAPRDNDALHATGAVKHAPTDSTRSVRVAHRALRLLAHIPGAHWRNTCLFRSVTECTVQRAHGWPARITIGVGTADNDVIAHSWVEMTGAGATASGLSPLRPARTGTRNIAG